MHKRKPLFVSVPAAMVILALGIEPAATAQKGEDNGLSPHRAVYDFTLSDARSSNSVSSLSGRMVYELTGSKCDGYTQTMRFVTLSSSRSGESTLSDQRTVTWEDPSAQSMRFQSSQYRDRKLVEQTAGSAKRGSNGDDISVEITLPKDAKAAIGKTAMFPVQHSMKLLDAARRGVKSFKADYYDGAEGGEKSYVVVAFIGVRKPPAHNKTLSKKGQAKLLDGTAAWPVSLSYYEHGSQHTDAVPVYEMSFLFYENGVSRRLMIDNGDYIIKGELSGLEILDPMPCRQ
ncbi:MAG: cell envelope integrity EipB family protein [Hyphomicrobiaceae bacterium]